MQILINVLREKEIDIEERVFYATYCLFEEMWIENVKKGKQKQRPTQTEYINLVRYEVEKEVGKLSKDVWEGIHYKLVSSVADYWLSELPGMWGTISSVYQEVFLRKIKQRGGLKDNWLVTKTEYLKIKGTREEDYNKQKQETVHKLVYLLSVLTIEDMITEKKQGNIYKTVGPKDAGISNKEKNKIIQEMKQ